MNWFFKFVGTCAARFRLFHPVTGRVWTSPPPGRCFAQPCQQLGPGAHHRVSAGGLPSADHGKDSLSASGGELGGAKAGASRCPREIRIFSGQDGHPASRGGKSDDLPEGNRARGWASPARAGHHCHSQRGNFGAVVCRRKKRLFRALYYHRRAYTPAIPADTARRRCFNSSQTIFCFGPMRWERENDPWVRYF